MALDYSSQPVSAACAVFMGGVYSPRLLSSAMLLHFSCVCPFQTRSRDGHSTTAT
uniref:Uncharacterized protein n=1 Tax=Anguilla anguilla TaxID=7936 RepID=A0A0E9UN70_ANGAN